MTNEKFMHFFNSLLVPLQAKAPVTMHHIKVPDAVSAEAKHLLDNVKGPSAAIDISNPKQRQAVRQIFSTLWKSVEAHLDVKFTSAEEQIAGVKCRVFTPDLVRNSRKKILYLHGGSYWMGSADANSSVPISLADKVNLNVISIDYRLAPEHPYPAAQQDTIAVYKSLLSSGVAAEDISIVGESAGGGLALSSAIAIRDLNLPKPAALGLISPWTDLSFSGDSHQTNNLYTDPWLSVEGLTGAAKLYAGSAHITDPGVSPLFGNMTGLPPMLIHVGSREIFLSDATRLARYVRQAGGDATLDVFEAMWHVWHFYPHVPEGLTAIMEMASFLRSHME